MKDLKFEKPLNYVTAVNIVSKSFLILFKLKGGKSCSVCNIANSYIDILAVLATGRELKRCQFGWQLSNILIG